MTGRSSSLTTTASTTGQRRATNRSRNCNANRPVKDQSKMMTISAGLVITRIVDIDFAKKHIDLNVEFIMKWTDELLRINSGVKKKERQ